MSETMKEDIAIIGMSIKVAQAENLEEFWDLLKEGKETISSFPQQRSKDVHILENNNMKFEVGSYLEDIASFDPYFFNITPREAELMSPIQRLTLEKCLEALDDAGISKKTLNDSKTGIYLGHIGDLEGYKYKNWVNKFYNNDPMAIPGNLNSIIPSRISYVLNLKGPAVLIDTACSSSLVAISEACKSITNKECDMAIAGGIRISFCPETSSEKLGIESSNRQTRPFDSEADGTVLGEGVGIVVLKRLADAIKDEDHIYSVIKGVNVNQDGSSAGITAPNGKAQVDLLTELWKKYDINPQDIDYIEAHGTGTKLGDPIEIKALTQAVSKFTRRKQFCGIGSVKSNIGHLFEAAGVISVIKTALMIEKQHLVPSINFSRPNRNISFVNSPFYLVNEFQKWDVEKNKLRTAGVSSFGFSGTNCHIILQEFYPPENFSDTSNTHQSELCFCFSNPTKKGLIASLEAMHQFLLLNKKINLEKLLLNLLYRKSHYKNRLVIISENKVEKLIEKINFTINNLITKNNDTFVKDEKIFFSSEVGNKALEEKVLTDLENLATNFCKGIEFEKRVPKLVPMPSIKFSKSKFWINAENRKNMSLIVDEKDSRKTLEIIIQNTFGYTDVNYHESFLDLGIDSIGMMKIINEVSEYFSKQLTIRDLYKYNTINDLSEFLNSSNESSKLNKESISKIKKNDLNEYTTSPQQKRMYIHQIRYPESTSNNVTALLEMKGNIQRENLEESIRKVLQNHEIFQTVFMNHNEIKQKILPKESVNFSLETIYLNDPKTEVTNLIEPFKLSDLPLFRIYHLVSLLDASEYLFIDFHHIICDVTSMDIFVRELITAYEGGEADHFDTEYKDYAQWLDDHLLNTISYKNQENYWKKEFIDYTSYNNRERISERAQQREVIFEAEKYQKIKTFCQKNRITEHVFLNTMFALTLYYLEEQNDQIIGNPVSGRVSTSVDHVIGIFTNTIATRTRITKEDSIIHLLKHTQSKMLDYLDNQDYQINDFVSEVRDKNGNRINISKIFAFQILPKIVISDGEFIDIPIKNIESNFELALVASLIGEQLAFRIKYLISIYDESDITLLFETFNSFIDESIKNPELKIYQLKEKFQKQETKEIAQFDF